MYRTGLFLIFYILLNSVGAQAQLDSIYQIEEVQITTKAVKSNSFAQRTESWDSTALSKYPATNVAEILSKESGVFVKNYGAGSLATTSLRGGSASHTAVQWNGFSLQSPMLGQLDFSLLPSMFVDELGIDYGGNSAVYGSGAVGGVITLDNKPLNNDGFSLALQTNLGSFGFLEQQARLRYGRGKFKTATRLFYKKAKNDFFYSVRDDLPKRQQTNSAFKQGGVLQEFYFNIKPNQQLALHSWWQKSDRQIPPLTTQRRSEAYQKDDFIRNTLQWKMIGDATVFSAKLGVFREILDYEDPEILLSSISSFWNIIGKADVKWVINDKQQLYVGIDESWTKATSNGYFGQPSQLKIALIAAYRRRIGKAELQLNVRQELVDDRLVPIVPSLGIKGELNKWLSFRAKVARNYRLPTFNDLYWRLGGDPNLKPEIGWSEEIGLTAKSKFKMQQLTYSATGFNRNIHDWIFWGIKDGDFFWSAINMTKVWSRGVEQRVNYKIKKGASLFELSAGYDFIRSTNQIALRNPKIGEGEQLIYVPKHKFFGELSYNWKTLVLAYQHSFTDHVGTINFVTLPSYHLGSFSLRYGHNFRGLLCSYFFQLDNAWDVNYVVIDRRPMPGRKIMLGLTLSFNSRKNK